MAGRTALAWLATALWLLAPLPQAGAQVEGAPLQGSMTLTPFEWRIEIALDGAMLREIGAVEDGAEFVTRPNSARAAEITAAARRWLRDAWRTESGGQALEWKPAENRWVQWQAGEGFVTTEREALPVEDAHLVVGFVLAPSPPGLPDEITWIWRQFPGDRLPLVPLGIHSDLTSSERAVSPGRAGLSWQRAAGEARLPPPPPSPPPPAAAADRPLPALAGLWLGLAACLLFVVWLVRRPPSGPRRWWLPAVASSMLAGALVAGWFGRPAATAPPDRDEGREVLHALLLGVYRALDYRDDEAAYHALERVAHGPLLRQLHREHRQALSMPHLGGAVAAVHAVTVDDVGPLCPAGGGGREAPGFSGEAAWTVEAALSHWGHRHERRLRYRAAFDIRAIDDNWRLTSVAWRLEEPR